MRQKILFAFLFAACLLLFILLSLESDTLKIWNSSQNEVFNDENYNGEYSANSPVPSGTIRTTVFKMGKADGILVETGSSVILIDTGRQKHSSIILDYLNRHEIHVIDYLIITHFDKDHVGSADKIIKAVQVDNIIQPDYERESKPYKQYAQALSETEMTPFRINEDYSFSVDGVDIVIYASEQTSYEAEEDNRWSLAVSMRYEDSSFLFAGDAAGNRLLELANKENIKHDFLKIPHHGIYDENSKVFLEAVSPQYAVLTNSKKTLLSRNISELLISMNITTFSTQEGNLVCISDGKSLTFFQ